MNNKDKMNAYADILQKKYNISDERSIMTYRLFISHNESVKLRKLIDLVYN